MWGTCSWPGVFLLGASGRTGRFFTQLLFHNPHSINFFSHKTSSLTILNHIFCIVLLSNHVIAHLLLMTGKTL